MTVQEIRQAKWSCYLRGKKDSYFCVCFQYLNQSFDEGWGEVFERKTFEQSFL
jgi:hypothetical protein